MLVVTRRHGESMVLRVRQADGSLLTGRLTLKISGENRIRVEFDAPAAIELWREEIANKGIGNGS
jgi:sRNA-binding carbon storage regulator CsrA